MNSSPVPAANPLSRNPLFATASAFACGIFLYLEMPAALLPFLTGSAIVLPASLAWPHMRTTAVLLLFVALGAIAAAAQAFSTNELAVKSLYDKGWIKSGDPVRVEGVLSDHPQASPDGLRLRLRVRRIRYKRESIDANGNIEVFVAARTGESRGFCDTLGMRAGNTVRFALRLRREEPFRNPGTQNYIDSLDWRGVDAAGAAKSCLLIDVTDHGRSWFSAVYEFRERLTARILQTHDQRTAGIVLASFIGNRNFLTRESGETFRENGTFHVLVISGLHITLFGGLMLWAARKLTSRRYLQLGIAGILLWSYALFVGLQLPVLRAAVMFSVFMVSLSVLRETTALNGLGAALLTVLVFRPSDLENPSFQMTSLSILAIAGVAFPVLEKLRQIGAWIPTPKRPFPAVASRGLRVFAEALYWSEARWSDYRSKQIWDCEIEKTGVGRWLSDGFVQRSFRMCFEIAFVSLCVQVFLLPLVVVRFHRVGTASIFSNLFAGAAVAFQNILSLAGLLLSLIDVEIARAFVSGASVVTALSLYVQNGIAAYIFAPMRVPVYTGVLEHVYWVYFCPLVLLAACLIVWDPFEKGPALRRWAGLLSLGALVTIALLIIFPMSRQEPAGRLRVDFLDVGQGDSALVTFPNGETMLIDGGGRRRFETDGDAEWDRSGIGERVVSEFLWGKGYARVDYVVSTHPDADHIRGLIDVVRNFRVGTVFAGGLYMESEAFRSLRDEAGRKGVPLRLIKAGDSISIGGAFVRVLHPQTNGEGNAVNDDSAVLKISKQGRSFLFTGDIETATEALLLEAGASLSSTVVKVPHHGSRTSSTRVFAESVNAQYAVIPVGRRSPFGHPHREVVSRWTKSGARVLSTGESGTISISTNGSDLIVESFAAPLNAKSPAGLSGIKPSERYSVNPN